MGKNYVLLRSMQNGQCNARLQKHPIAYIPRGATLAEREIDVEIDEVFRRARILDAVIAEVKPKGVFVDGVGLRKNKVRFGYMIIPKKSRHLRDAASGLNRKRNVFYQFALDRATGRLIFMYEYGQVNPRRVRLKGKCQVRP